MYHVRKYTCTRDKLWAIFYSERPTKTNLCIRLTLAGHNVACTLYCFIFESYAIEIAIPVYHTLSCFKKNIHNAIHMYVLYYTDVFKKHYGKIIKLSYKTMEIDHLESNDSERQPHLKGAWFDSSE